MLLEIITPEKRIFEGEVDSVTLPGSSGEFAILKNHAPIISSLQKGTVKVISSESDKIEEFAINSGVVETKNNKIIILAD